MIYVRKANARGHANHGWLETYHSFSFANYYDPDFMGFSDLRVINEDRVQVGKGFGQHPHKNMEILSYVLEGTIEHQDSMGFRERVKAGEFQIMSAGTGIHHSEYNPSDQETLHFYQIWIKPNEINIKPRYETRYFPEIEGRQLILSSDARENSLKIYQDMNLWRWRFKAQEDHEYTILKRYGNVWIQVVTGELRINGQLIQTSDGVAVFDEENIQITTVKAGEILLFELL